MVAEPSPRQYTFTATPIGNDAWYVIVCEQPGIWTIAYSAGDRESRIRERLALDLGGDPSDFDVAMVASPPPPA